MDPYDLSAARVHFERLTGRCRRPNCHKNAGHDGGVHMVSEQTPRGLSGEAANEREAGGECSAARFPPIPGVTVIGIGHRARHGKDTAAKLLTDRFNGVQRYAFADDLYAVCRVLHGMTAKDAPLLQRVGVEHRQRDENVWVRSVYGKILADRPRVAVITDVRFPNEMDFVKSLGGECWKVERRLPNGDLFIDPSRPADHVSEIALAGAAWERTIVNPQGEQYLFNDRVLDAFFQTTIAKGVYL